MCLNEGCEVQRLRYDGNRRIRFFVLNDSKLKGKCQTVLEKVKRPILSFSYGLPLFQFTRIDQVLQQRFYSISFPVQKKRLWNCSKSSANLGKKPTTLLLTAMKDHSFDDFFHSFNKCVDGFKIDGAKHAIVCAKTNRVMMENIVFNLVGIFAFVHDIRKEEITQISRFVEFNHFELVVEYDIQQHFPLVFTPNVKTVGFYDEYDHTENNYDDFDIDTVLQHLPNVEKIKFYYFEMPKLLLKINHDFGPKLTKIFFNFLLKAQNYDLLAQVMRKQSSNACFYLYSEPSELADHMKNLLLYFEPVAEPVSNRVSLTLKKYPDKYYFVLRDLPDFHLNILRNRTELSI
uniref:DUF38 domain-containing protein n=1 Tax=Panagrolaimus sp. JU765 TaxID=591449 RepID=A0AC34Q481_9BILA